MWAMSDFTEENGATRVVPGSHRAGDRSATRRPTRSGAEMRSGSVVLYLGLHLPRRRGQPFRRGANRHERRLQRRLAAPGGEPVPRGAARGRPHPPRVDAAAHRLRRGARTRSATWATCATRSRCCGPRPPGPGSASAPAPSRADAQASPGLRRRARAAAGRRPSDGAASTEMPVVGVQGGRCPPRSGRPPRRGPQMPTRRAGSRR